MRRRWLRVLVVIFAMAVAGISYRVLGVYRFRTVECGTILPSTIAPTYPKRLVVMAFNIQGHASFMRAGHIEEIAATIRRHDPDIVGINEAHRGTWQARFGDHVEQLRLLTGMNVVFGRSYRFAGGDFGNAVLTKGDVVSTDVHELPGTGEPRSLLDTIVRINGGTIEFYVTHTSAWASLGEAVRDEQMKCVRAHVEASRYPFIVVGDLNAPPESPEIASFLSSQRLQLTGDPGTSTHKVMGDRLDYIVADSGWVVRSARVLDEGPSDHRPVIAELTHP
jgi:endonuclease/exonuclease/phosphatase family metal-dependent hydrolase